jgi:hypothetical protein
MGIGRDAAIRRYKNTSEISESERHLLDVWENHKEKARVTTVRMYPETIDALKKLMDDADYKAVPDYVVLDNIIKAGISVVGKEGK